MNSDGRMDIHEFSIAMKLIKLKLQGHPLPPSLPPSMKQPPLSLPPQSGFGKAATVWYCHYLSTFVCFCLLEIVGSPKSVYPPSGMPSLSSMAPPLAGVPPIPLPPLPVGVSPPLVPSGPPPLPPPIANGAPSTGMMQPISGFSHPGKIKLGDVSVSVLNLCLCSKLSCVCPLDTSGLVVCSLLPQTMKDDKLCGPSWSCVFCVS